ncbi:hypothetical protein FB390_4199 [Nocardia bhagyanarayanae]|uniref:Uncharacterized protein n=1 Tax=Nocardia bhagyanarayanae TaxID=1215925 RepID=A0A543FF69_9NOCA|nr:hypothetical protein FB390_4199 [Nocardia bhagyanarayanae]
MASRDSKKASWGAARRRTRQASRPQRKGRCPIAFDDLAFAFEATSSQPVEALGPLDVG